MPVSGRSAVVSGGERPALLIIDMTAVILLTMLRVVCRTE